MSDRILILSEATNGTGVLADRLVCAGFSVKRENSGRAALKLIRNQMPALVVLDLVLPDMCGLELCRYVKSDPLTNRIAVVLLSSESDEIDRIIGFELGADDCVVKPFSPRELVLRIKAILRQGSRHHGSDHLRVGDLVMDRSRREVKAADRLVRCTAIEFKLLGILMEREGRVQRRDQLLNDVWGYEAVVETRTVDSHMRRLRDKLGPHGRYIETIRGVGYRVRGEGRGERGEGRREKGEVRGKGWRCQAEELAGREFRQDFDELGRPVHPSRAPLRLLSRLSGSKSTLILLFGS